MKVEASFDALNKQLAKAAALVAKEGIPAFYFKALVLLEERVEKNLEDKVNVARKGGGVLVQARALGCAAHRVRRQQHASASWPQ